ncbi:hypothetical protein BGW38_003500, partial [Lunasporangiospora selenospora]
DQEAATQKETRAVHEVEDEVEDVEDSEEEQDQHDAEVQALSSEEDQEDFSVVQGDEIEDSEVEDEDNDQFYDDDFFSDSSVSPTLEPTRLLPQVEDEEETDALEKLAPVRLTTPPPLPPTEVSSKKSSSTPTRKSRRSTRSKKSTDSDYVVPDVGDIYVGFHQAGLSESEKTLRQFDLASQFGPCGDMTRLERWERASLLGLGPPQDIKDMILKHTVVNTPVFEGEV